MMSLHAIVGFEGGVKLVEGKLRAVHHRHGDGPVQRHHRVRRDTLQQVVQPEDLRPVGFVDVRGLVVDRRNC